MKKSQSCPCLFSSTLQKNQLSTMKKTNSCLKIPHALPLDLPIIYPNSIDSTENVLIDKRQNLSKNDFFLPTFTLETNVPGTKVDDEIETSNNSILTQALHNLQMSAVFKTPLYHVGMCMVENKYVDSIEDILQEKESSGIIECLASPCETDESDTIPRNINVNYLTNENRIGELLARIRRHRRVSRFNSKV